MASKKKRNQSNSNGEVVPSAISGPMFFYEDEVFRVNKSGEVEFGMVTENWEFYSSESDASDGEHDTDLVPKGHVAITWHPSGKEDVLSEGKVCLSDRSLMPGDVVRKLHPDGKDTQRGYARSVRVHATVQAIGSKEVYPNVPAATLTPVQKFPPDVAVYLDSWIGTVRDMRYHLTLRFNDKSTCIVDSYPLAEYFRDVRQSSGGFCNSGDIFYPGQRLQGEIRYLRTAAWSYISDEMKRAKDRKQVTGLVLRVEVLGVNVQWQYQTPLSPLEQELSIARQQEIQNKDSAETNDSENRDQKGDDKLEPPTEQPWERKKPLDFVKGDDSNRLKSLNLFDSCTVQLGDISFYTVQQHDMPVDKKVWKKEKNMNLFSDSLPLKFGTAKLNQCESSSTSDNDEENANTVDDLQGNNKNSGSGVLTGTAAKKFLPKVATRALRKKKYKKSRPAAFTDITSNENELVVETIHTSTVVDVVWQDGTIEENLRSIHLYPIHHLDDHEMFPGDFVIRGDLHELSTYGVIQHMDHNARVATVKWFEPYTTYETAPRELNVEEVSVYDIKDHPDFRFRPGTVVFRIANIQPNQFCGGQVLDNYPDGKIQVWWANNVIQECWPQDLYRIGDYDSDEGELWDNIERDHDSDESWETDDGEEPNGTEDSADRKKSGLKRKSSDKLLDAGSPTALAREAQGVEAEIVTTVESQIEIFPVVPPLQHFVILPTAPALHRLFPSISQPNNTRNFVKSLQKEYSLLRNNLPPGIYVKGFEDRMDLFSVMIHGPRSTPYEDGLFFFDIQLPAMYPESPPIVQYISFCQSRLNPNLYECGKVCVSLLGTWSGKGNETWTPDSSVLQLLISIQGLILVPEPYYNEAGYERQRGSELGRENSRMYNEMAIIKLLQSMTKMICSPHVPWEVETPQHIRSRGPLLIKRYKKWLNFETMSATGTSSSGIGEVVESNQDSKDGEDPGFPLFPVSKGFSMTLRKMLDTFEKAIGRPHSSGNTAEVPNVPQISPVPTQNAECAIVCFQTPESNVSHSQ